MSNRDFWKEWNRGEHYGVGAQKIVDSVEQEQMPREMWEALREYKEYYRNRGFVEAITFTPKEDTMSEYTPTTEEVETHWADVGFASDRASFRRWLAEVERAAAEKALTDLANAWHAEHSGTRPVVYKWLSQQAATYRQKDS